MINRASFPYPDLKGIWDKCMEDRDKPKRSKPSTALDRARTRIAAAMTHIEKASAELWVHDAAAEANTSRGVVASQRDELQRIVGRLYGVNQTLLQVSDAASIIERGG